MTTCQMSSDFVIVQNVFETFCQLYSVYSCARQWNEILTKFFSNLELHWQTFASRKVSLHLANLVYFSTVWNRFRFILDKLFEERKRLHEEYIVLRRQRINFVVVDVLRESASAEIFLIVICLSLQYNICSRANFKPLINKVVGNIFCHCAVWYPFGYMKHEE